MTLKTMEDVVFDLNTRGIPSTLEYPGCIQATVGDVTLICGGANETVAIDVCEMEHEGTLEQYAEVIETIESDIPSNSDDAGRITDFFACSYTEAQIVQEIQCRSKAMSGMAEDPEIGSFVATSAREPGATGQGSWQRKRTQSV